MRTQAPAVVYPHLNRQYRTTACDGKSAGHHREAVGKSAVFNGDKQIVYIDLTEDMQRVGEIGNNPKEPDSGEYWTGNYQEIYAEVILQTISTKSQIIDVDIKAEVKKQKNPISTSQVNPIPKREKSSCLCAQYDLVLGNKVD